MMTQAAVDNPQMRFIPVHQLRQSVLIEIKQCQTRCTRKIRVRRCPKDIQFSVRGLTIIFQGVNRLIIARRVIDVCSSYKAYLREAIIIKITNLRHTEFS